MKKALLILLVIFMAKVTLAQQYVIKANITGFKNGTKFYLSNSDLDINIDSAIIKNNLFVLKGQLPEPPQSLSVSATVGEKSYYFPLLIGNEQIEVKGDANDFPFNLSIKGSKIQDTDNELTQLTKDAYKRHNDLMRIVIALRSDSNAKAKIDSLSKVMEVINSNIEAAEKNFVKTHLNSYAGLDKLFYLKETFTKDTLQKMYNRLTPQFKQSRFGKRMNTYIKIGKILQEGDEAADFTAFDSDNKTYHLSDFKNKYILLDFAITNCDPCIESIGDMKKLSAKYPADLSVITYSGDAAKATWLTGVNRDNTTWLSLWDGKGYYGDTNMKYGVSGYPTFVLIDPKGKIVSIGGFEGKGTLEARVDALISKK